MLDNFSCLCRKAQELVFEALACEKTSNLLYIAEIGDEVSTMSPIEQIFYIGNLINSVSGRNFSIELVSQKDICVRGNGKKYRVDFFVGSHIDSFSNFCCKEYILKTPIIIELDGADYHSNKVQMNYDYERENNLKLEGYNVIRFTGSQIYNDVFGCLDKVCEFIKQSEKTKV